MRRFAFAGALFALFASCFAVCAQADTQTARHVFIISFDGGKPAVMQQSPMPNLNRILNEGAGTWNAQTTFPSITLTSHTSMLSGVGPAKHRVLWNDWKPAKGLFPFDTVFSIAKAHGLSAALFAGKDKFKHFNAPGALDICAIPAYPAKTVAAAAAKYILERKPNICFIHFADSDGAGHKYGWGTPQQVKAFADEDAALGVVRGAIEKAGIAQSSVMILSADHGGHNKTHGSNAPEDMTIPWIVWGARVKRGYKILAPVTTYDTAATALWLLGLPPPHYADGKPVTSAFALK